MSSLILAKIYTSELKENELNLLFEKLRKAQETGNENEIKQLKEKIMEFHKNR